MKIKPGVPGLLGAAILQPVLMCLFTPKPGLAWWFYGLHSLLLAVFTAVAVYLQFFNEEKR